MTSPLRSIVEPYSIIYADPPWNERGSGKVVRGAQRHYPLMKLSEIVDAMKSCELFVPAEHCCLALWATANHLGEALGLIEALDFKYVTNAVWVKDRVGLGQWFRMKHEHLLIAKRGEPLRMKRARVGTESFPSEIEAPRMKHSEKPPSVRKMLERWFPGPRLEMFSRHDSDGWDEWGMSDGVTFTRRKAA